MSQIILPELGEDIQNATVALWHFKIGDAVKKDDDIVELVTDKASFNVSAPQDGVLKEIKIPEGQQAKIGCVLGVIQ